MLKDIRAFKKSNTGASAASGAFFELPQRHDAVPDGLLEPARHAYTTEYRKKDRRATAAAKEAEISAATVTTRRAAAQAAEKPEEEGSEDQEEECNAHCKGRSVLLQSWEASAGTIISMLGRFAGGRYALPSTAQYWLVHIMLNQPRHEDPGLSVRAFRLLQQDLAAHPPAQLVKGLVHRYTDTMWHPLMETEAIDRDCKNFSMLLTVVDKGLTLLYQAHDRQRQARTGPEAHAGHALLLLHLVQLFKQEALPRLQLFKQRLQQVAAAGEDAEEGVAQLQELGQLIEDTLLLRVLATNNSWALGSKCKGQFVADLMELVALGIPDADAEAAPGSPAPAAAAGKRAASPSGDAVAAAAAAAGEAAVVSPAQLVGAAQQLLVLLLELYSCCEAAGVYSHVGRHRTAAAGAGRQNERLRMDDVLVNCLTGTEMLVPCKQPAGLRRVLQALPATHLSRLLTLLVANAIAKRPQDTAPEDPLLTEWREYFLDTHKEMAEFVQGQPVAALRALLARWDWACSSIPISNATDLFTTLVTTSISGLLAGGSSSSGAAGGGTGASAALQQQEVKELQAAAVEVLEAVAKGKGRHRALVGSGGSADTEAALLDVGKAWQVAKAGAV